METDFTEIAFEVFSALIMNYPAAELRGIKMNFYLFNPDAEHRGILLIKTKLFSVGYNFLTENEPYP
jgi:hypothetical protein